MSRLVFSQVGSRVRVRASQRVKNVERVEIVCLYVVSNVQFKKVL